MTTYAKIGRRLLALGVFVLSCLAARAQVQGTLTASAAGSLIKAGDKLSATLSVRIDPGWHISSLTTPDGGPVRSEISLAKGSPCKLAGKIDASEPRREHSRAFDVDVETYEGEATFQIPLQAMADLPSGTKLVVEFTYQACTEETCNLPKTVNVEMVLGGAAAVHTEYLEKPQTSN